MDDTQDPLIKAIMDAGLYGQRMQPLQQRYQLGQQFTEGAPARGAQVGGTYVASSPLEHLANAVRSFVGARMMKGAQQGQQDLTSQLGAGRSAYAQALRAAGGQPPPGTPEMLGRPADPQETNRLAMLGSLSGDPAMQHAAQMAMTERHADFQDLQLQNTLRHQQALEGQGQQKIGLTAAQQKTMLDGYGNPITVKTHALPGAVGAAGGGGGAQRQGPPTQAAIDQAAQQFATTGAYQKMPGRAGTGFDASVRNRVAELYPDASFASNKADYVANTNSLRKMQAMSDSIDAFEGTALKNSRMLLDTAKGIVDTGSPFFNQPLRAIQKKFAGDPKMAQFNAARQVAVQEIGKVLGGAVAGGAVTDSQRHEVESLISGDMTIPQMEATLQTLEADMANRKVATQAGMDAIRKRMTVSKGPAAPQAAAPAAPAPAPAPGAQPHPQDSAAVQWAKAHPEDPRSAKILQVNGAQ